MIWIILGALIIATPFAAVIGVAARAMGWRATLLICAFTVTITAIITGASLLIGYGVEGHL